MECLEYMTLANTQYCLHNAKNNNNPHSNFLPDIDPLVTFSYATIYLRVMLDFILKTINL